MLLAAPIGIVTNYATASVPGWFADPGHVWLVLAILVLLAVIADLVIRLTREDSLAVDLKATAPASLRRPTVDMPVLRGRDTELTRLLKTPKNHFAVVCGAGGMGKTTLACIAAEQAEHRGRTVFWVRWQDLESLGAQLIEVACTLGLPRSEVAAAQQAGASVPDLIWRHLNKTRRWLLVLDNVDDPRALSPHDPVSTYRGWVRPGGRGLLLITSRDRSPETWGRAATLIDLAPLTPHAGGRLLLDLAPHAGSPEEAESLATRLGGLPLALHAAGSALAKPTARLRTVAAYQQALQDASAQVLPDHPDITNRDTARTLVGHTWDLSLTQLEEEGHPLARPLLRALSLLAEAPIPLALITPDLIPDATPTQAAVDAALAGLHRYGLLDTPDPTRTASLPTVVLHPLVRETTTLLLTRDQDPTPWQDTVEAAILILAETSAPQGRPAWPLLRLLAPTYSPSPPSTVPTTPAPPPEPPWTQWLTSSPQAVMRRRRSPSHNEFSTSKPRLSGPISPIPLPIRVISPMPCGALGVMTRRLICTVVTLRSTFGSSGLVTPIPLIARTILPIPWWLLGVLVRRLICTVVLLRFAFGFSGLVTPKPLVVRTILPISWRGLGVMVRRLVCIVVLLSFTFGSLVLVIPILFVVRTILPMPWRGLGVLVRRLICTVVLLRFAFRFSGLITPRPAAPKPSCSPCGGGRVGEGTSPAGRADSRWGNGQCHPHGRLVRPSG
ncbi:NB-ARC domain-containing protein [Actinokineospora iranica]|uniref:NB-ARC domain-containing protein n=1 Tax=Actinokineospora iranica TaxID=1271860 RepID=A0A1G6T9Z4_9PSEU|nr:NB-ARC domain-containing protein [Actinokineospora iranica]